MAGKPVAASLCARAAAGLLCVPVGCPWPRPGCFVCSCSRRAAVCARGLPVATAGLLCVPVGGGPPARSPHASLRLGVIDLEARPGPATARGHRSQASLAPCVVPAHRWSSRWTYEPVGERASVQLMAGQNVPGRGTSGHVRDKIRQARGRWGISVTKFPLLAQKRGIRAVLPVQGEFCPGLGVGALSRESFVPVSVSLRKIGRVASRHRPIGGRAAACEIGAEVSDRHWRGSWARRCGRGRPRTGDQHASGSVVPQSGHRW